MLFLIFWSHPFFVFPSSQSPLHSIQEPDEVISQLVIVWDTIRLLILAPVSRCRDQSCYIAQLPGRASELLPGTVNRCWLGSFTEIVTNRHTVAIWTVTMTDFPSYKKYRQNKSCQPELDAVLWLHRKSAIWVKLWSPPDENIICLPHEWRVYICLNFNDIIQEN